MALCYVAVACNGTRDNIYGIYPTYEAALERLKQSFVDLADEGDESTFMEAKSLEALGLDAKIIEISDGGEALDIELH